MVDLLTFVFAETLSSPELFHAVPPPEPPTAAIRAGQEEAPPPETPLDTCFKQIDRRKGENRNPKAFQMLSRGVLGKKTRDSPAREAGEDPRGFGWS